MLPKIYLGISSVNFTSLCENIRVSFLHCILSSFREKRHLLSALYSFPFLSRLIKRRQRRGERPKLCAINNTRDGREEVLFFCRSLEKVFVVGLFFSSTPSIGKRTCKRISSFAFCLSFKKQTKKTKTKKRKTERAVNNTRTHREVLLLLLLLFS